MSDTMARIYRRKVGMIKKSVYVNIPSKIAKTIYIAKGTILYVTLQGNMVVLSKDDGDLEPIAKPESLEAGYKQPDNAGGPENSRNNILDRLSDW